MTQLERTIVAQRKRSSKKSNEKASPRQLYILVSVVMLFCLAGVLWSLYPIVNPGIQNPSLEKLTGQTCPQFEKIKEMKVGYLNKIEWDEAVPRNDGESMFLWTLPPDHGARVTKRIVVPPKGSNSCVREG